MTEAGQCEAKCYQMALLGKESPASAAAHLGRELGLWVLQRAALASVTTASPGQAHSSSLGC